ncbi:MAG: ATP-dependent DNA helicase [archaeon]
MIILTFMLPETIPFRYDQPRTGQEKLILDAYEAFKTNKIFLAHAETGLGKTDASLSAALGVALKSDPKKTIIFLTPKNAQHQIAIDCLREINQKFNLKLRVVDLVGKEHLCVEEEVMQKEGKTFYEWCKKKKEMEACGFYRNARGYNTLQREKATIYRTEFAKQMGSIHSAGDIKEAAKEFSVAGVPTGLCPYEAAMDLAKKADVIIADYYHIFSPSVSELVLPKLGKKPENCILIVDEAHNLPERVRGLLSTNVTTKQLQKAAEEALQINQKELSAKLFTMEKTLREKGMRMPEKETQIGDKEWPTFFEGEKGNEWVEFGLECEMNGISYLEKSGKENSVLLHVGEFFEKWGNESEGLARILKKWEFADEYGVSVKALDPKPLTGPVLQKMHACLLMSGTLHPTAMYLDILGIPPEKGKMGFYPSPFPKQNRLNLISAGHTTKYSERSEDSFQKIAEEAGKIVNQIPGNAVVFFPSFKMLENIGNKMKDFTMRQLLFQRENMKMQETEKMVNEFKQHSHGFGAVLLACTSGSFAEGLDFPGNQLLGVVIVGIPLAEMNLETRALVDYYEKRYRKGWDYGYIFPAMGRAVQAAGRVIRTPNDLGTIVFLDKRYTWKNYLDCLPPTQDYQTTSDPAARIKRFWQESAAKP